MNIYLIFLVQKQTEKIEVERYFEHSLIRTSDITGCLWFSSLVLQKLRKYQETEVLISWFLSRALCKSFSYYYTIIFDFVTLLRNGKNNTKC